MWQLKKNSESTRVCVCVCVRVYLCVKERKRSPQQLNNNPYLSRWSTSANKCTCINWFFFFRFYFFLSGARMYCNNVLLRTHWPSLLQIWYTYIYKKKHPTPVEQNQLPHLTVRETNCVCACGFLLSSNHLQTRLSLRCVRVSCKILRFNSLPSMLLLVECNLCVLCM